MDFGNVFGNMFCRIGKDQCKLSMNGEIAIKTSSGYKTYNLKTNRLVNCAQFVFPGGDEMFFAMPTTKVKVGDIILANGLPKCVIEAPTKSKDTIQVVNYETGAVETILPERHVFMGETYMYSKIVSLFGSNFMSGKKGMNKLMSIMMMQEMMKGTTGAAAGNMNPMMMMFMMNGNGMDNMFSGMFDELDFGDDDEDDDNTADAKTE